MAQMKEPPLPADAKRTSVPTVIPFPDRPKPSVSVIVPTLNDAENLPHVLPRIPRWVHEVILIDSGSTDDTVAVAQRLWPEVRIIQQHGRGKGTALRTGFSNVTGDIIVMLDADGSTDPAEIPFFAAALVAGADLVKGSRFVQGGQSAAASPLDRLGNWAFGLMTKLLFGTRYTDITYGYTAMWRRHANVLATDDDGWASVIVGNIRAARNGLRVVEVASAEHKAMPGQAKVRSLPQHDREKPSVSVVIPVLNEAENLPHVLPRIPRWVHEVIVVDGNSTDDTVAVAQRLWPEVRIIQQRGRGKGAALRTGFSNVTGDIIVMLDADGSTDPAEIPFFAAALVAGADLVKGSRFVQGGQSAAASPLERLGNWSFGLVTKLLFGTRYTDITYGYTAMWRRHANVLATDDDGWANVIVGNIRAARNGLRVVEVASAEHKAMPGQAKVRSLPSHDRDKPSVSVVIPVLNEAENLPHVLPRIPRWVHEVIVVDGNSTDDTVAVAQRLWPEVRIIQQRGRGK